MAVMSKQSWEVVAYVGGSKLWMILELLVNMVG